MNVKALLADLLHDQMVARIERLIHEYYLTLPAPLDARQRRTALEDIGTKRLAAERLEIAAVLACRDGGIDVPLRADTNPVYRVIDEVDVQHELKRPLPFGVRMAALGTLASRGSLHRRPEGFASAIYDGAITMFL